MKVYPLAPNGVFWTLQGEGAMRGQPMVFVRLAGCSVGCAHCDTDYSVAERLSVDEILQRVLAVQKRPTRTESPAWVWLTGGEPTDHDLEPLVDGLRAIHCSVALATSGVRSLKGYGQFGFISVSPHDPNRWEQRGGTELKIVPGLNGFTFDDALPYAANFHYRYAQPLWGPRRWDHLGQSCTSFFHEEDPHSLAMCRDFVLEHPDWALTDQGHKRWGLP